MKMRWHFWWIEKRFDVIAELHGEFWVAIRKPTVVKYLASFCGVMLVVR